MYRPLASVSALLLLVAACNLPTPPAGEGDDTTGAADPDAGPVTPECIETRAATEGILRARCGACHDGGQTQGKFGGVSDLDGLIAGGYVVRGAAADSVLFQRISSGEMPVGADDLPADEQATIERWIDVCTPAEEAAEDVELTRPPACLDNEFVVQDDVLAEILADLTLLDSARQRTTRYVTFAHLHSAGFCEEQLEGYRHAFAKLINHLSLAPTIRVPDAIDEARTIYRIDLVDYGWTADTWAQITAADPYAIAFRSDDARKIQQAAEVELFSVKGDWFIEAASQPPLYHTVLGIPGTRAELESELGVNVDANLAEEVVSDTDEVLRAGFRDSKVSRSNRAIERHEVPSADYRAYWLSYDFADNEDEKDILVRPLDFVEDGGEIIFTLPNGLQGYMIVDAAGARIDRAPIAIVHDGEVPEEPEVINGLSCMSCHSEGMRRATDEVRGYAEGNTFFDAAEQEQIAKLYAPQDVFDRAQQRDIETFAASLAKTGSAGRVGGYEPVMAAHIAFELERRPAPRRRRIRHLQGRAAQEPEPPRGPGRPRPQHPPPRRLRERLRRRRLRPQARQHPRVPRRHRSRVTRRRSFPPAPENQSCPSCSRCSSASPLPTTGRVPRRRRPHRPPPRAKPRPRIQPPPCPAPNVRVQTRRAAAARVTRKNSAPRRSTRASSRPRPDVIDCSWSAQRWSRPGAPPTPPRWCAAPPRRSATRCSTWQPPTSSSPTTAPVRASSTPPEPSRTALERPPGPPSRRWCPRPSCLASSTSPVSSIAAWNSVANDCSCNVAVAPSSRPAACSSVWASPGRRCSSRGPRWPRGSTPRRPPIPPPTPPIPPPSRNGVTAPNRCSPSASSAASPAWRSASR
ncbi:hypothetical protein [Nannocystis pusilla]|uniref:hypothetical protein n=1 Tax=Nannocystis pusilla TaxID=889268 RepID=UPI003DA4D315